MGNNSYSSFARESSGRTFTYASSNMDDIFKQKREKQIHKSMDPANIIFRECRDSETHPLALPIIFALDLTGSMLKIPLFFIRDGLPNMIDKIIKNGFPDPAVLMMGVGDSVYDTAPLQVGQFESGDRELDTWLERLYPEGGGGGNAGESYLLSWWFAAHRTQADHFDKRNKKGILITIGDEPCIGISKSDLIEIVGPGEYKDFYEPEEILKLAMINYDIYHLHILEGVEGHGSLSYWKNLLGQNCIEVPDHKLAPDIIAKIVLDHVAMNADRNVTTPQNSETVVL